MTSRSFVESSTPPLNIQQSLARLTGPHPPRIDLGLTRMQAALARLGHPHLHLPPVIHVAGTNGKGSVIAYMRTILAAANKRVHCYVSPELTRFNERIILDNTEITDTELARIFRICEAAIGDQPLTHFEAITTAAFVAFSRTVGDVVLLETGLGGRLDATNVIPTPAISVITPVAMDHQDFLGETLAEIAAEKAGIMKQGCPVVIGKQCPSGLAVLERRAQELGATTHILGQDWHAHLEEGHLVYQDQDTLRDLTPPRLLGTHQIENAGLAVAALQMAGLAPSDSVISAGLRDTVWPARLQRLRSGPALDLARQHTGQDVEIWLDGGHNSHAAQAVARSMADLEDNHPKPLILIAGMQNTKDAAAFFIAYSDIAAAVFTLRTRQPDARSAEELAIIASQHADLPALACTSLAQAVERALCSTKEGVPRLLICGSLYLASEVLAHHS